MSGSTVVMIYGNINNHEWWHRVIATFPFAELAHDRGIGHDTALMPTVTARARCVCQMPVPDEPDLVASKRARVELNAGHVIDFAVKRMGVEKRHKSHGLQMFCK